MAKQLKESGKDESLSYLFLQIQDIVSEQFGVELGKINLDSNLGDDFRADDLDGIEIIMEIQEYFNSEEKEYRVNCTIERLIDYIYELLLEQNQLDSF